MTILFKNILYLVVILSIIFCSQNQEHENQEQNTNAITVYNQAYQENYEADKISDILENANNAYVLIDPFQDTTFESVAAIKANGNQVGAYISIGTGEDWRDDFNELQPFLVSQQWGQWPGEYFVNKTTTGIIDVMKERIDKIANWGCD